MSSCTGSCLETCREQNYWGLPLLSWPVYSICVYICVYVLGKRELLCIQYGLRVTRIFE